MKRVGIVGCGSIAQVHGWVLSEMEDVQLAAVCDIEPERAKELARKYAVKSGQSCAVVTDWRELCDMDLDVIHICTPHYLHAPMAVAFLDSGKGVFMEKPCAIDRQQFEELKRADAEHPGKLGFCFQNRYNETTRQLDLLVAEGRIGEVIGGRAFVTWRRDESYYQSSLWKGRWETEGGGALINQSIHTLDLLLRYLGKPERVEATMANHHLKDRIRVEDTVEAWMEFPGEKRACFYASNGYATDAPILLELQGTEGRLTLQDQEVTIWTKQEGISHISCEATLGIGKSYWGAGHRACIWDYYKSLNEGKALPINLEGVETTFDTMMRIYESAAFPQGRLWGGDSTESRAVG